MTGVLELPPIVIFTAAALAGVLFVVANPALWGDPMGQIRLIAKAALGGGDFHVAELVNVRGLVPGCSLRQPGLQVVFEEYLLI